ncbi:MAG TPA: Ig-like domain-containing protein [Gaiellaceae bacterium]|nr:Ig-like domain-containing protein [Gaiellaceae bacterium]
MKRLVVLLGLVAAAICTPQALAVTMQVSVTSPASGAHSLSGVVPVIINASSDVGVYGVQLQIDHKYYGVINTVPFAQYTYEIDVDASTIANGDHTLTAIATDWSKLGGGAKWASRDVTVDFGPAYPTISMTAPASGSKVRGTVTPAASATSAVGAGTVTFSVDAAPLTTPTWDTTTSTDGSHTITGTVVDGRGKTASATTTVTVDNTAPATAITSPSAGSFALGTLSARASATDASGIASVQFALDGTAAGAPVTTADNGTSNYSASLSLAGLAKGSHTITSTATDAVGNTTTSAPVSFQIGDAPPTVTLTVPPDWSFAHGTVPVTATVNGGTLPDAVKLVVDGKAVGTALTAAPYTFQWNTTTLGDGTHTLAATVTDALNRTATSPAIHVTVENSLPVTYIVTPSSNAYFQGTMTVEASASDSFGVASVQFAIDGNPVGSKVTVPELPGGFVYSSILDLSGLANGPHALTSIATSNAGMTATSSPVTFMIGTAPGVVSVTAPLNHTFVHGVSTVTGSITGGTGPFTAQLIIDNVVSSTPATVNANAFSFQWNTAGLIDGSHVIAVAMKGGDGITVYSSDTNVTVDNIAPTAVMYQPVPLAGYTYARVNGPVQLQVHASDGYGVASVQFTVDGAPVGSLLTAPDSGQQFLYSATFDASTLAAGMHSVAATVTDNAGNVTNATALSIKTGPITYVPVLNYHGITGPLDTEPDIFDQTPAEADAELAYLKANGYQSITVEQYRTWLTNGTLPAGITKPVLITVDDGLADEVAWDALLQKYGFKAVLYVVTGFADSNTPGETNDAASHMTWTQIQQFAANGRWQIAFHAGQYGHGDFSDGTTAITLSSTQKQTYANTCWTYYGCLGTIATTTTTGTGRNRKTTTTTAPETAAQFQAQVTSEVNNGINELLARVPSASLVSFACPWNACGQWTTFYNDPSGAVQNWLPGFLAGKFPIVFTQTNPITYGLASGTVGALNGFNRHYRFEVHTDTTIDQFAAALTDPAFANN